MWKLPGQGCARADGALTIGPLILEGEDVTCQFTNVSRSGATVTWTDNCDSAGGAGPETVVATAVNERLTIRYVRGASVIEGMTRCPAGRQKIANVFSPFTAANATFALNAALWFRLARLLVVSPYPRRRRRFQAETPLSRLSRVSRPPRWSQKRGPLSFFRLVKSASASYSE